MPLAPKGWREFQEYQDEAALLVKAASITLANLKAQLVQQEPMVLLSSLLGLQDLVVRTLVFFVF